MLDLGSPDQGYTGQMSQRSLQHTPGSRARPPSPHRVVAIVDLESNLFELGYALQILSAKALNAPGPAYDFQLCAANPAEVLASGLFRPRVHDISLADHAQTLLVPNRTDIHANSSPAMLAALCRAGARGARLIACWTGAFTLAEADVLDGRRATTHWRWADVFRSRYPKVGYESDVLFVDDGDVLTGAGGASAIDLGLHVIRNDLGVIAAD